MDRDLSYGVLWRSDKIRWPIAVIFDPIELGPERTQSPEPDAYERFIYSQGVYAPLLDRNEEDRTMEFGCSSKEGSEQEWILTRAIRRAYLKTSLSRDICEYLDVTWT